MSQSSGQGVSLYASLNVPVPLHTAAVSQASDSYHSNRTIYKVQSYPEFGAITPCCYLV